MRISEESPAEIRFREYLSIHMVGKELTRREVIELTFGEIYTDKKDSAEERMDLCLMVDKLCMRGNLIRMMFNPDHKRKVEVTYRLPPHLNKRKLKPKIS